MSIPSSSPKVLVPSQFVVLVPSRRTSLVLEALYIEGTKDPDLGEFQVAVKFSHVVSFKNQL